MYTIPVASKTRTYYIAAVEMKWDYAPSGYNKVKGIKLENDRYEITVVNYQLYPVTWTEFRLYLVSNTSR